jgi:hypothetical protein
MGIFMVSVWRTRPCWRRTQRESLVVIAGDDVRLNYADTYFGKPRQMQAAKLFDGLQASGRSRDDGTGCFSFGGCPLPWSQRQHGVCVAWRSTVRAWSGSGSIPAR